MNLYLQGCYVGILLIFRFLQVGIDNLFNYDKSNSLDISTMESGATPNLPGEFCNPPEGKQRIKAKDLQCVWFEDGHGVALLEKGEIPSPCLIVQTRSN